MQLNSDNTTSVPLPTAIGELLAAVRSQLRRYSVLSGVLWIVIAFAACFWVTASLDLGWFALQRLELPVGLRMIMLVVMATAGSWLLVSRVIGPLLRRHRDREIALLLERRFPEFQDRLVTALESSRGYPGRGPIVHSMLEQTATGASQIALEVRTEDVFRPDALKLQWWLAAGLLLSVLGCGIVRPGSLDRWWSAFVRCAPTYHQRTTDIEFRIVAQPGDRRLEFRTGEGNESPLYLHPNGSDFELEMTVPDGQSESGDKWVIPERVRVDVTREDGTLSRTYVSASSERKFRFVLTRLQETVTIEVLAGDFRTPRPLTVRTVTPPSVDKLTLECSFPEYTRWNQIRQRSIEVLGNEFSVPVGTTFELTARSNKPIADARLVSDLFELTGDRKTCSFTPGEGYDIRFASSAPLVSDDGYQLTARFLLTPDSPGETRSDGDVLPVPSNTSIRFFLHDEDDIVSVSPQTVRVRGLPDRPPLVATRTSGVTNAVTRRATIPFVGMISDDYGLESARFQFIVDDETSWRKREFRQPVRRGVTEYELNADGNGGLERFEVQPLELTEGQTLSIAVVATDACTEPSANTSRAEPVVFRIVSNEELLSLLYTRELNLRQRFEEVIGRLQQIQDDLRFHQEFAERLADGLSPNTESQDRIGLTDCARRSGDSLRAQRNELASIAAGFDEVIEQLVNNQIPPKLLAENMRKNIVLPMQSVLNNELDSADRTISRYRVAANNGEDCSVDVVESRRNVEVVIVELQRILENVRDMAEFHEVLSDLNAILKDQQRIQKETNVQQIRNLGVD